jgi:hypothetical protein
MPQQKVQQASEGTLFKREDVRTMKKDIVEAKEKRSQMERAQMGGFKVDSKTAAEKKRTGRARMEVEEIERRKAEQGIEDAGEQWIGGTAEQEMMAITDEMKKQKIKEIQERETFKKTSAIAERERTSATEAEQQRLEEEGEREQATEEERLKSEQATEEQEKQSLEEERIMEEERIEEEKKLEEVSIEEERLAKLEDEKLEKKRA